MESFWISWGFCLTRPITLVSFNPGHSLLTFLFSFLTLLVFFPGLTVLFILSILKPTSCNFGTVSFLLMRGCARWISKLVATFGILVSRRDPALLLSSFFWDLVLDLQQTSFSVSRMILLIFCWTKAFTLNKGFSMV